jgi:hypothetical protein
MKNQPALEKRSWTAPKVQKYGTFVAATLCDKDLGSTDGFTFQGQAIVCVS